MKNNLSGYLFSFKSESFLKKKKRLSFKASTTRFGIFKEQYTLIYIFVWNMRPIRYAVSDFAFFVFERT